MCFRLTAKQQGKPRADAKRNYDRIVEVAAAKDAKPRYTGPLVVLTSRFSASAGVARRI